MVCGRWIKKLLIRLSRGFLISGTILADGLNHLTDVLIKVVK